MRQPQSVPKGAVYNAEDEQWERGPRGPNGQKTGEWRYWWGPTGDLCCVATHVDDDNFDFTRLHPDGTYSKKGAYRDGHLVGPVVMQRSRNRTAERVLSEPKYEHVFRVRCVVRNDVGYDWQYFDEEDHRVDLSGERSLTPEEFALNFRGKKVPEVLARLLDFQANTGPETYSEGFALTSNEGGLIASWSSAPAFTGALYGFAQANGTGSCYALWDKAVSGELGSAIIVAFGDEGGAHVIADDFDDFLLLLGADREPSISHEGVSYASDVAKSAYHDFFKTWLKDNFKLTPNRSPQKLVKAAQATHERTFKAWLSRFAKK